MKNQTPKKPVRKSTRLKNYDYSQNGFYFVTVCVRDKKCLFGEIVDGVMFLNKIGEVAQKYLQELPNKFPDVALDEFVIMPNHFHAILIINRRDVIYHVRSLARSRLNADAINLVPTGLSAIIRYYKGRTKFEIGKIDKNFDWQSRFYDHIIRDEKSLDLVREYIVNNPLKWELDELFCNNNP